ncbi:MAG: ribonuclease HII [Anaerolineae bacterium]|nr:ribonuclease HII [Anaerolineae bacterium]
MKSATCRPDLKSITPTLEVEAQFWTAGLRRVAGLDEAGRGAWAGPVYAGAVILPSTSGVLAALEGVRDSKQLSPRQREAQFQAIAETAVAVGVGWATAAEIDALRIVPATRLAMRRALAALLPPAHALVIDALPLPEIALPQRSFPFADAFSLSVAAASIVAKVSRDRWMAGQAESAFPGYGFARHKGYGTPQHRLALEQLGVSDIHRRTFRPIAARLGCN